MAAVTSCLYRPLAALVTASVLVAGTAFPAAHADSVNRPDPSGDIMRIKGNQPDGEPPADPAPNYTGSDIINTRIRHMHSRVRVRVTFADLQRRAPKALVTTLRVVPDKGPTRTLATFARPGRWDGTAAWEYVRRFDCPIHHSIDYGKNYVVMGFSRACLSNPRWIRVSVVAVSALLYNRPPCQGATPPTRCFDTWADDGQRRLIDLNAVTPETGYLYRLSPRLYRGPQLRVAQKPSPGDTASSCRR